MAPAGFDPKVRPERRHPLERMLRLEVGHEGSSRNSSGLSPAPRRVRCRGGTGAATVNITLTDSKIVLDKASVPSGKITFNVKNTGTMVHEVVVLKTDLAQDKIPADPAEAGKVSEDASLGETGDVNVGETKPFSLDLQPGNYVLICNEVGHYLLGMHISFVVK